MGCSQSTERKGASAPVEQQHPQPIEADVIDAAVVAVVPTEPSAQEPAQDQPVVEEQATVATASEVAPTVEEQEERAVVVDEASAVETDAPQPQEAAAPAQEPQPAVEGPKSAPVVPSLALPRKRASTLTKRSGAPSRASSKNSRATATRRAQKENTVAAKSKTPSKTPTKRGLSMSTSMNQPSTVAPQKKVFFDAIPAQEDATTKMKNKAKKVAGRHACNVNEELFLASIAAFERQLTHRASLDSQLNSR